MPPFVLHSTRSVFDVSFIDFASHYCLYEAVKTGRLQQDWSHQLLHAHSSCRSQVVISFCRLLLSTKQKLPEVCSLQRVGVLGRDLAHNWHVARLGARTACSWQMWVSRSSCSSRTALAFSYCWISISISTFTCSTYAETVRWTKSQCASRRRSVNATIDFYVEKYFTYHFAFYHSV